MSSHFPNRVSYNSDWFVFDAYYLREILTPQKIRQIFDSGKRKIYISMGNGPSRNQKDYQDSLDETEFDILNGIQFEAVLVDSLNPPHSSIRKMIPSKYYLKGRERDIIGSAFGSSVSSVFGNSWKEGDYFYTGDFIALRKYVEEYKAFPKGDFPTCRKFYKL
jgi:hypothetical protein